MIANLVSSQLASNRTRRILFISDCTTLNSHTILCSVFLLHTHCNLTVVSWAPTFSTHTQEYVADFTPHHQRVIKCPGDGDRRREVYRPNLPRLSLGCAVGWQWDPSQLTLSWQGNTSAPLKMLPSLIGIFLVIILVSLSNNSAKMQADVAVKVC